MYKAPKEYNLKSEIAFSSLSVCFFPDYLKTIYIDVYRTVFKYLKSTIIFINSLFVMQCQSFPLTSVFFLRGL